jgi:hypothetical protein
MKRQLTWFLGAALAVGGVVMGGCDRKDSTASNTNKAAEDSKVVTNKDEAAKTAGAQIPGDQIGAVDLNNIYRTLGDAAEAGITKGGFDDMVERFAEPDRKRIGDFKDQKFADLDGRIDQFRNEWKAKYNADLDIDDKVFENWLRVQKVSETGSATLARATIPASHGLPDVTIPLVKDALAWRIDLPDTASGEQLKTQVLASLTKLSDMKATWPADQLDAKRAVVHHVYAGLLGVR